MVDNSVYTPQEMEQGLRTTVPFGNGCFFSELKEKTSEELNQSLEARQEFKDQNNPFKGDINKHLRQNHRQDLGY